MLKRLQEKEALLTRNQTGGCVGEIQLHAQTVDNAIYVLGHNVKKVAGEICLRTKNETTFNGLESLDDKRKVDGIRLEIETNKTQSYSQQLLFTLNCHEFVFFALTFDIHGINRV